MSDILIGYMPYILHDKAFLVKACVSTFVCEEYHIHLSEYIICILATLMKIWGNSVTENHF